MEYPTRNGISIPVVELNLPESQLDPSVESNYNNHHNEWTARQMGRSFLLLTLRNLASHQFRMLLDVHEYVHQKFDPPKMPTPIQAMAEIERAYDAGEELQFRESGRLQRMPLTREVLAMCIFSYEQRFSPVDEVVLSRVW